MARLARKKKQKWFTVGDKQQAQQENGENGDHSESVRENRKNGHLLLDVRHPPDHVWNDICRAGVSSSFWRQRR
jgi:hypothetical protein